jgi:hypothetical protein
MLDEGQLRNLLGHDVVDPNGKSVGYVDVVFSDDESGRPEWVGVMTGTFRHRYHLVPVSGVDREHSSLRVPWTKDRIKHAPEYGNDDKRNTLGLGDYRLAISKEKERAAYEYYGLGDGGAAP